MKQSTKRMAPGGLPPANNAEVAIFKKLLDPMLGVGCAACLFFCRHPDGSRAEGSEGLIHHILSGGKRISHRHVIPLCEMHHTNGRPGNPSRHSVTGKYGKAEFEATYADEMELLMLCEERINDFYLTGFEDATTTEPEAAEAVDDSATIPDAYVEPDTVHVEIPEDAFATFSAQVNLHFVHRCYKVPDSDGSSVKAAIDGLVAAGLLADDSPKEVKITSHEHVKIPRSEKETTTVIITEVAA